MEQPVGSKNGVSWAGTSLCEQEPFKGELQCKTTQKEVKEWPKTKVSSVLVFQVEPPIKEISLTIAEI